MRVSGAILEIRLNSKVKIVCVCNLRMESFTSGAPVTIECSIISQDGIFRVWLRVGPFGKPHWNCLVCLQV